MTAAAIADRLQALCLAELLPHTRLTVVQRPVGPYLLKREDDLWLGGNKLRKAASLIPWLRHQGCQTVALIGGAYSNHVVAMAQLLPQYGFGVHAFLRGEPTLRPVGNQYLLQHLVPPDAVHWVPRADWQSVVVQATEWAGAHGAVVIPEGGCLPAAAAGAATLATDIWANEAHLPTPVDHLWLDAGTGLTGAATLLTDALHRPGRHYHVVLLAGDADSFMAQVAQTAAWLEVVLGVPLPLPSRIHIYVPSMAPRFGQVTPAVRAFCQGYGLQTGILPDPIYTAKLLHTLEEAMATGDYAGSHMAVHSGGQVTLLGVA